MNKIHCITLNVRGLRNGEKRKCVFEWAKLQKADVLMLQETHMTADMVDQVNKDWPGSSHHSFGNSNARGVSIMFRQGLNVKVNEVKKDSDGRKLLISADIHETSYAFTCVYAPTHDRVNEQCTFFRRLRNWLSKSCQPGAIHVIGGDLNIPLNPGIDRTGVSNVNKKVTKQVAAICKSLKVTDIWRLKHPSTKQYTYRSNTMSSRIDYWLVSDHIGEHLTCDIRPSVRTDHNAVSLKIQLPNAKRGPGSWKLNSSFLNDGEYKTKILEVLDATKHEFGHINKRMLWDLCKANIKEASIEFGKQKAKERKTKLEEIQNEVDKAESKLNSNRNADTLSQYTKAKDKMENFYTVKAQGAQVRSRAQWYESGERNTKFFLGLERKRSIQNTVSKLTDVNGKEITDLQQILTEEVRFYKHLYASRKISDEAIQAYLESINLNQILLPEQRQLLEGKLTNDECIGALKKMKLNKSPGGDGIPIDFYKEYWDVVGELVLDSLNEAYDHTELSNTQKTAVLTLIHKKGDRRDLGNWRPISLLNGDYKLAAQILANRLQQVLSHIIHSDQAGYVRGRFIGNNIRLIQDIIDIADQQATGGAILFLDFKKAFDSLEKNFLFAVLKKFNFGSSFMQWVKTLYNGANSMIANNGWLSTKFTVERGIRQGCPLSALLFIIAVEILATVIRKEETLQGITITNHAGSKDIRLCQLADDTTIFAKDFKSVERALNIVETFGSVAGLELNRNKTEGLWLGVDKHRDETVGNISWPKEPIKALGVFFGHDKAMVENCNWNPKVQKLRDVLRVWQMRKLTMFGRLQLSKRSVYQNYFITRLFFQSRNMLSLMSTVKYFNLYGTIKEKKLSEEHYWEN